MRFMSGLQIVLIALKLIDKIDYSWWIVLLPILFTLTHTVLVAIVLTYKGGK